MTETVSEDVLLQLIREYADKPSSVTYSLANELLTARRELAEAREGQDAGVDFVLDRLAKALKLDTYDPKDGTGEWESDVVATLDGILRAAKVIAT
ncbi:MAG: hypothetical protein JWM16_6380 [Verrucomicrobiales bacterium]|nr:hypothetical protein [Verrucomicrobiales bacterium]